MPKSVFTDAYANFTALLVETRLSAGLTQTSLARVLGKPQSFVSKIETGERRLDVIEFCDVARALGKEPAVLLGELTTRKTMNDTHPV
jgi:transcriptional regulator with XRE-family HTH domain